MKVMMTALKPQLTCLLSPVFVTPIFSRHRNSRIWDSVSRQLSLNSGAY